MDKLSRLTKLTKDDQKVVHRDHVRLLGEMAKLLDGKNEKELRLTLIDLGLREGTNPHEEIVKYWRSLLNENPKHRKPSR